MTTGGWITMLLSVGFVTVLFGWCIAMVLARKPGRLHGIEDIDTRNREDERRIR